MRFVQLTKRRTYFLEEDVIKLIKNYFNLNKKEEVEVPEEEEEEDEEEKEKESSDDSDEEHLSDNDDVESDEVETPKTPVSQKSTPKR